MAIDKITVLLLLGGFIGWTLYAVTVLHVIKYRKKEIEVINQIQQDIKIVRQEVSKLK